jgi:hypothetical protein
MSHITTCPHCSTPFGVSERITDKTLICPHCLADVDNARPGSQIRADDINTNVKRDLSVGSIVLAVLIGLCVFGILGIGTVFSARRSASRVSSVSESPHRFSNTPLPADNTLDLAITLMYLVAALDVLVSIAILRGLIRWGISGLRTPSVGKVLKVLGIAFLSLGTIVAIVIFSAVTCLSFVD